MITYSDFEQPLYNKIPNIRSGDIVVPYGDGAAYMYIDNTEINSGVATMPNTEMFTCPPGTGAWIRSENWWSHSVIQSTSSSTYSLFIVCLANGAKVTSGRLRINSGLDNHTTTGILTTAAGANICYSFGE